MYRYKDIAYIVHPKTAGMSTMRAWPMGWVGKGGVWRSSSPHHELDFPMPKYVISVVREPEDWYTSWFFHYTRGTESFDDWLTWFIKRNKYSVRGFFGLEHTTHLIFFEKLTEGWDAVTDDLLLPRLIMPHLNKRGRHGRPASEFFTDSHRELLDSDMVSTYASLWERLGDESFLKVSI